MGSVEFQYYFQGKVAGVDVIWPWDTEDPAGVTQKHLIPPGFYGVELPELFMEWLSWGHAQSPMLVTRSGDLGVLLNSAQTQMILAGADTWAPSMDATGRRYTWWLEGHSNDITNPRTPTGAGWTAGTATMTENYGSAASPDGTFDAARFNCASGQFGNYRSTVFLNGTTYWCSWWVRATTSSALQGYLHNLSGTVKPVWHASNAGVWVRNAESIVGGVANAGLFVPCDGDNLSGFGGLTAGARDQLADFFMITQGTVDLPYTTTTVGPTHFRRPANRYISPSGRFDIDIGTLVACMDMADIVTDKYIFWIDANNWCRLNIAIAKFELMIGGVIRATSPVAHSFAVGDSIHMHVWCRTDSCGFEIDGQTATGVGGLSVSPGTYVNFGSDGTNATSVLTGRAYGDIRSRYA